MFGASHLNASQSIPTSFSDSESPSFQSIKKQSEEFMLHYIDEAKRTKEQITGDCKQEEYDKVLAIAFKGLFRLVQTFKSLERFTKSNPGECRKLVNEIYTTISYCGVALAERLLVPVASQNWDDTPEGDIARDDTANEPIAQTLEKQTASAGEKASTRVARSILKTVAKADLLKCLWLKHL